MKVKFYMLGPVTYITNVETVKSLQQTLEALRKKGRFWEIEDAGKKILINPDHVVCLQEIDEEPVSVDQPVSA